MEAYELLRKEVKISDMVHLILPLKGTLGTCKYDFRNFFMETHQTNIVIYVLITSL